MRYTSSFVVIYRNVIGGSVSHNVIGSATLTQHRHGQAQQAALQPSRWQSCKGMGIRYDALCPAVFCSLFAAAISFGRTSAVPQLLSRGHLLCVAPYLVPVYYFHGVALLLPSGIFLYYAVVVALLLLLLFLRTKAVLDLLISPPHFGIASTINR